MRSLFFSEVFMDVAVVGSYSPYLANITADTSVNLSVVTLVEWQSSIGWLLVKSWPCLDRYLTATVYRLIVGCCFADGSPTDHRCITYTWSILRPIPILTCFITLRSEALFLFRFVNNIPAGKVKWHIRGNVWELLRFGLISGFCYILKAFDIKRLSADMITIMLVSQTDIMIWLLSSWYWCTT